ncbi:MAG: lipid-A-disaccharide synthase [Bacteroidales bacterium]|nr:lipid-A-disaccharide synthase [Bacteroidales bacterium]
MRYYLIAGEASGDLHGSNLMRGIYGVDPEAVMRFWGGDLMLAAYEEGEGGRASAEGDSKEADGNASKRVGKGGGLVSHYKEGAVMGYMEVLKKAGKLLGNVRRCRQDVLAWRPDVVVLIDYPGFNFKIAKFAHEHGLKVYYYIAPKVWASRENRVKKLRKYVDKLFIVFPFEMPYFTAKGIDFVYKGNPLVDAVDNSRAKNESREEFLQRNGLEDKPIIAMLAGSRKAEISTMTPPLLEFAKKMHATEKYSGWQFLVAGAPARSIEDYSAFFTEETADYIHVLFGETQSILKQAEAAVVNSGTASLEAVLLDTPQVVCYKLNPISYVIGRIIAKIKYISLGNLCIDRLAFKELIQDKCEPDAILAEIRTILEDADYAAKMHADYAEIRALLGGSGTSAAVARAMVDSL